MRTLIQSTEVDQQHSSGRKFSAFLSPQAGLIRGIAFLLDGTGVGGTTTALQDDGPFTLISDIAITIPLKSGDVTSRLTGQDLYLLSRWLRGHVRESDTAASDTAFRAMAYLPLGGPRGGYHTAAMRPGARIVITGTWGPSTAYVSGSSSITTGRLIPSLDVDVGALRSESRRGLVYQFTRFAIESSSRFTNERVNKPSRAQRLLGVLWRSSDVSADADRVDGLVTRYILQHTKIGILHDQFMRDLRDDGADLLKIPDRDIVAASPLGLDGTAYYVAASGSGAPDLVSGDLVATLDAAEAVPPQTTDVTPASGDEVVATVVADLPTGA